jgi:hypothetical protein
MEEKYGKGLCPFKDAFLETIKREYPDLKVVEGTHPSLSSVRSAAD